MTDFQKELLAFAEEAADRVGGRLLELFGKTESRVKEDGSLVTGGDEYADETLRRMVAGAFPDHRVLSEEGSTTLPGNDWCWVIDPVDGTTNFASGIPIWAISLSLLYRGRPLFGSIAVPPVGERYHGFWFDWSGIEGENGAFRNGEPIDPGGATVGSNRLFNVCSRTIRRLENRLPCKIRMLGSAAYNLVAVASGSAIGGVEATPKVWDIAGAWPIAHAAGAVWIPLDGKPPFPIEPGVDYGSRSFPTLLLAGDDLVPRFRPLIEPIFAKR